MDASKPAQAGIGRVANCIASGATTLDEYRKNVGKRRSPGAPGSSRCFVSEPTVEDTVVDPAWAEGEIRSPPWRAHHRQRAWWPAANLSNRYISDRFLPDKAIDLMDEAASRLRMQVDSKPEELDELDRKIIQLKIRARGAEKRKRTRPPGTGLKSSNWIWPRWRQRPRSCQLSGTAEKERLSFRTADQGRAGHGAW